MPVRFLWFPVFVKPQNLFKSQQFMLLLHQVIIDCYIWGFQYIVKYVPLYHMICMIPLVSLSILLLSFNNFLQRWGALSSVMSALSWITKFPLKRSPHLDWTRVGKAVHMIRYIFRFSWAVQISFLKSIWYIAFYLQTQNFITKAVDLICNYYQVRLRSFNIVSHVVVRKSSQIFSLLWLYHLYVFKMPPIQTRLRNIDKEESS